MNNDLQLLPLNVDREGPDSPGNDRVELSARQVRALHALLAEPTIVRAASRAGVHERTVRKWLCEPAFKRALDVARRQAFEDALGQLRAAAGRAVEALLDVVQHEDARPADRVSAARVLLDNAHRAHEAFEVAERIESLEAEVRTRTEALVR